MKAEVDFIEYNQDQTTNSYTASDNKIELAPDAYSLGIRTEKNASLDEQFVERRALRGLGARLAVMEMLAKVVIFRSDFTQLKDI